MNTEFDELTKSVAQSVTRRAALRKSGRGVAGMALACLGLANRAHAAKPSAPIPVPPQVPCQTNTDCQGLPLVYRCCYRGFCSYFTHCVRFA